MDFQNFAKVAATQMKIVYDAFMEAGFSEEQSFQLLRDFVYENKPKEASKTNVSDFKNFN